MRRFATCAVLAGFAPTIHAQFAWWAPPAAFWPRPADREDQVVVYDAWRSVTVLFGGRQFGFPSSYRNDTWTWDGQQWRQVATTGPGADPGACGAYDDRRGCLVLRTGDATWEWNGAAWAHRVSGTPPVRTGDKMAFDRARGDCVLFGTDGVTWTWNGQLWTQHQNSAPSGMVTIGLAFDPQRQRVLRCGGVNFVLDFATWTWDGAAWHREQPATSPFGRRGFALFDDGARVLLYGGDLGSSLMLRDLWAWDGANWQELAPLDSGPAARFTGCTFDLVRRRAVVTTGNFGGFSQFTTSELFEIGPTTPDRSPLGTAGPGPGGRAYSLVVGNGQWPALGATIGLSIQVVPAHLGPAPAAWLAFSTNAAVWAGSPLPRDLGPFGALGSTLWIDPVVWLPTAGASSSVSLGVPDEAALLGLELFAQALVPLPGFNGLGASTTNAMRFRIGRL